VDLAGLQPTEAARVLGVAPGTLRMRLMRARARLRKAAIPDLAHGIDPASEPEVTS
jgi:DNA-directed RNA polymerase specialized sigma24 family protein